MATIKEIAEKYSDGMIILEGSEMCKDAYIEGASAVLVEISALLPSEDNRLNDYGKALWWRLNEKIKELKGEQL